MARWTGWSRTFGQQVEELGPWQVAGAEAGQVGGDHLDVDQAAAGLGQAGGQVDQGDLGGVGGQVEHGLAGEHPADRDPVQAPDQLAARPHLQAVGVAEVVQALVGGPHRRRDPGPAALVVRGTTLGPPGPAAGRPGAVGAAGEHRREGAVDGRLPARAAQPGPQRPRTAHPVQRDHAPRVGREPGQRRPRVRPGEDPPAVGVDQGRRLQVGADPDQPVLAGGGRVGEPPSRRAGDGHGEPAFPVRDRGPGAQA